MNNNIFNMTSWYNLGNKMSFFVFLWVLKSSASGQIVLEMFGEKMQTA